MLFRKNKIWKKNSDKIGIEIVLVGIAMFLFGYFIKTISFKFTLFVLIALIAILSIINQLLNPTWLLQIYRLFKFIQEFLDWNAAQKRIS